MQCKGAGHVGFSPCGGVHVTEGPWKEKFDKVGSLHDKLVCFACIKIFFIEILSRLKAWFGVHQRPFVKWSHIRVSDVSKVSISETGGVYVRAIYSNQLFYVSIKNGDVPEGASRSRLSMFEYSSEAEVKRYRQESNPVVFVVGMDESLRISYQYQNDAPRDIQSACVHCHKEKEGGYDIPHLFFCLGGDSPTKLE